MTKTNDLPPRVQQRYARLGLDVDQPIDITDLWRIGKQARLYRLADHPDYRLRRLIKTDTETGAVLVFKQRSPRASV